LVRVNAPTGHRSRRRRKFGDASIDGGPRSTAAKIVGDFDYQIAEFIELADLDRFGQRQY